ncbi:TrkA family potassium uptake protein [candidate division KSB1 bacterium]|nr:TrkA family potassium uptake protein [candidate division KSB1 bacterium]
MTILIVGGGRLIYFLVRMFTAKGHHVTVINRNLDEGVQLARRLKVTVVHGDGSDPQILEEAGAYTADIVLSVTPNDEDNLVICQLANQKFKVPKILALVNDPDNEQVFQKLGILTSFSTTRIISSLIEQRTAIDGITNLIPVAEGKINVTEINLKADSLVVGKSLIQIQMPTNSLIACILREGAPIIPSGSTLLQAEDKLIVITLPENHGKIIKLLSDER